MTSLTIPINLTGNPTTNRFTLTVYLITRPPFYVNFLILLTSVLKDVAMAILKFFKNVLKKTIAKVYDLKSCFVYFVYITYITFLASEFKVKTVCFASLPKF